MQRKLLSIRSYPFVNILRIPNINSKFMVLSLYFIIFLSDAHQDISVLPVVSNKNLVLLVPIKISLVKPTVVFVLNDIIVTETFRMILIARMVFSYHLYAIKGIFVQQVQKLGMKTLVPMVSLIYVK